MTVPAGRVQHCEHVLYGCVTEANLSVLFHRLRGLCDYATEGGIPFSDREIILRMVADSQSAATKLHVRQSLDDSDAPWILSYQGQLELGDINRLTAVRNCIHAGCSHNLLDFLKDLGFTPVFETILKGHIFRKGIIRVLVFRIYQPNDTGDVESARPVSPNYLIEMSAVAASGQDAISGEMKNFAEHLKPIVSMEKTDGIR